MKYISVICHLETRYHALCRGWKSRISRLEGGDNWRKAGRKIGRKRKRFVRSARLSFEGEIDSRWRWWVPGATPSPLRLTGRPFLPPPGIYLFPCGSNTAGCLSCFSICLQQKREWRNGEKKGALATEEREGQTLNRGWVSKAERER